MLISMASDEFRGCRTQTASLWFSTKQKQKQIVFSSAPIRHTFVWHFQSDFHFCHLLSVDINAHSSSHWTNWTQRTQINSVWCMRSCWWLFSGTHSYFYSKMFFCFASDLVRKQQKVNPAEYPRQIEERFDATMSMHTTDSSRFAVSNTHFIFPIKFTTQHSGFSSANRQSTDCIEHTFRAVGSVIVGSRLTVDTFSLKLAL